jgi:two-component system response regulator NreC
MHVLFVDDHQILRDSMIGFFRNESFCRRVEGVSSVTEARDAIAAEAPDVVVTDLSFPAQGGPALIAWCQVHAPRTAILCLTMHAELSVLKEVAAAGARGYVTKSSGYDQLVTGIRVVADGGYYLDQTMLAKVLRRFAGDPATGAPKDDDPLTELTEREREIFFRLLDDASPGEIGSILFISAKTVENHRSSIYRKLGVHDRLGLFSFARQHGLVE